MMVVQHMFDEHMWWCVVMSV